jgi:transcription termination factor Rho
MSIITAEELEASPLADLHALASTLGIDGFRRLRKSDLVAAIIARQSGGGSGSEESQSGQSGQSGRSRRRRRGRTRDADPGEESASAEPPAAAPRVVEGVVELLANGSGFVRPDDAGTDGDVYISAAQARRCELVAGDRISGPVRAARRSERHPSLIRIDTINGVSAEEAVHGARIDDIEVDWPVQRIALDAGDELFAQIERHAPFGAGSRVLVTGPPRAGKTFVLSRLAAALSALDGFEVELTAVGVRPEELGEYRALSYFAGPGNTFAASRDAQDAALEQAVERGRRVAVRGGNAILLVDTLDGLSETAARRTLAAARNLRTAGSLTVIATASRQFGGETTVIALSAGPATPTLEPGASGTLRAELLASSSRAPRPARARKPRQARAVAEEAPAAADGAPAERSVRPSRARRKPPADS